MGYQAIATANYFLDKARRGRGPRHDVSPMKVQKLVWYAHGWHYGLKGRPLVRDEQAEAWEWGPVFPSLYRASKSWGNQPIQKPMAVGVGPAGGGWTPTLRSEFDDPGAIVPFLDSVWEKYEHYSAVQLSNSTHDPGTPWHEVYVVDYGRNPPRGTDIPPDLIKSYFSRWAAGERPAQNRVESDGVRR